MDDEEIALDEVPVFVPLSERDLLEPDPRKLRRVVVERYRAARAKGDAGRRNLTRLHQLANAGYSLKPGIYLPGDDPFDDSPGRVAARRRYLLADDARWKDPRSRQKEGA